MEFKIGLNVDELEEASELFGIMADHYRQLEEPGDAEPATLPQTASVGPSTGGGTVELDARGVPWDARIHARTKSKTNAGTWTKKRGVNDAEVVAVEAEIVSEHPPQADEPALVVAPVVAPVAAQPAPVVAPVVAQPAPVVAPVVAQPAPVVAQPAPVVAPVAAQPAPVVVAPVAAPPQNIKELVDRANAAGIGADQIMVACRSCGYDSLPKLAAVPQPDDVPAIQAVALALGL